jgi:hypothetical protein
LLAAAALFGAGGGYQGRGDLDGAGDVAEDLAAATGDGAGDHAPVTVPM